MPEIEYVKTATYSPTCCALCGTSTGPFVDCAAEFQVASAEGLLDTEGHLYLCVGKDDGDVGCARQVGRASGCLTPAEHEGLLVQIRAVQTLARELEGREQALMAELAEERAKPRLVSADELLARVAQANDPPVG